MDPANRKLLIEGAAGLGVELSDSALSLFSDYLSVLDKWSRKMNLTGLMDERDRVIMLILDSLSLVPVIREVESRGPQAPVKIFDLGSGAGAPGVMLAIAMPEAELVLCESREKRASFLREVVRKLGLKGVKIFEGRAEDWQGGEVEVVVSRAVADLEVLAGLSSPLLSPGGLLIAMKGPDLDRELEKAGQSLRENGFTFKETRTYNLPGLPHDRLLALLHKSK